MILQLWSLEILWPLKLSFSPCIRTIQTRPLPGRFVTSLVDLEPLNYYPDGGNGDFRCFSSFLTATFYYVLLNNLVLHIRTIFYIREFGLCVLHIYNPVEQEVMAGQFHAPSHSHLQIYSMTLKRHCARYLIYHERKSEIRLFNYDNYFVFFNYCSIV